MTDWNQKRIQDTLDFKKQNIDPLGSGMCSAKWLQTTIHLSNGTTHSCHHPKVHKIPVSEIEKNPSALHNTSYKKQQRSCMLSGERPSECQYCWNIEDMGTDRISDRTYKSTDPVWGQPYWQRVIDAGAHGDVMPSYLEVSFDTTCQMMCMYCQPTVSSRWWSDVMTHGGYDLGERDVLHDPEWLVNSPERPIPQRENNPWKDAWWKWWPEVYPHLEVFRITGGEPLLSRDAWRAMAWIRDNPRHIQFSVNSNLCVAENLWQRLVNITPALCDGLREFSVYTSAETVGAQQEYTRWGMNWEQFAKRCREILSCDPRVRLSFMTTVNALSMPGFQDLLEFIRQLRVEFNPHVGINRVPMMINYLRWPEFQSAQLMKPHLKSTVCDQLLSYVEKHCHDSHTGVFYLEELDQTRRLCEWIQHTPKNYDRLLKQFWRFYQQWDQRQGVNINQVWNPVPVDSCK